MHLKLALSKKAGLSNHLFVLKCLINKYCNKKGGSFYACFNDFHKVFDIVLHKGLKLKF